MSNSKDMGLKNKCPMCGFSKTDFKAKKDQYEFYECPQCLFVFCPEITPEFLAAQYAKGYHGPEDGAPDDGWSDVSFLQPAFELLPKEETLKILDFGTGQSLVPDKLRERGHKVVAVDIVEPIRPHEDRITGDIFELELEAEQFDLVFSFQVFEHLPQPKPVLDKLLKLVKPQGLLLIHTDMETAERFAEGFENWWYVSPPDHCAFYKHATFEYYLINRPDELIYKDEKRIIIQKK